MTELEQERMDELERENRELREEIHRRKLNLATDSLVSHFRKERIEREKRNKKNITPQEPTPSKSSIKKITGQLSLYQSQRKKAIELAKMLHAGEFNTSSGFSITGFFAWWSIQLGYKIDALGKSYYKAIEIFEDLRYLR